MQTETPPRVLVERDGSTAWLTLDGARQRNALDEIMLTDLDRVLTVLRDDESVRIVVLTGAPPVFSAGAKTGVKSTSTAQERGQAFAGRKSNFRRLFERCTAQLEQLEQVTIAMVNGHAVGAGWGLALTCDFCVAAEAAQFWIPEVELGVVLGVGSTTRLVRAVGPWRAKAIVLEGRRFGAPELQQLGLVHRVAAAERLREETGALADALAAKPFAPLAQMKARINAIARNATPEVSVVTEHFLAR